MVSFLPLRLSLFAWNIWNIAKWLRDLVLLTSPNCKYIKTEVETNQKLLNIRLDTFTYHYVYLLSFYLQIRTPYNLILVNLALVEFLLAFFGVSMDVLALIQDGWQYGKDLCMAQGALVTTAGMTISNNKIH